MLIRVNHRFKGLLRPINSLQSLLDREKRTTCVQIGKIGGMSVYRGEALEVEDSWMWNGSSAFSSTLEYIITAGCQSYALLNE